MNFKRLILLIIILFTSPFLIAQEKSFHVNASLFMLVNIIEESPKYAHIEFAKILSDKHIIGVEFLTWEYRAPLGIPYGKHYDDPNENFPGVVKDIGLGVSYQYFYSKNWFSKFHITPFYQQYLDESKNKIQSGFQLFSVARTGYRWEFYDNQLFIEPSIAITAWPINTNMPSDFQLIEDNWPSFFLFEPGLNIGFRF
ncbi:hypothetical protein [Marinicellulosiphila megalodicopiae]|uniref:hypothetical protein n=1 Tax=Marinicellulosiphila megalodicopiae TaxID=2724896 RepID=UPI003BAE2243